MTEIRLAPRMTRFHRSPTNTISQRARELRGEGRDVISLSAGEPDFDTPEHIKAAARDAMDRGETKYTTVDGIAELKAAIVEKFRRENGLDYETNQISVGTGGKQVIFNALMATVGAGDEVIVPAPHWVSYPDMVRLAGGDPVIALCRGDRGFLLAPEDLEAAITPRTKWLMLNNPNNPSGAVYDEDALRALAEVLKRHPHVWILTDDMYEHLMYDNAVFHTIAQVEPALHDRTLTVNGVSKAYCMTGWRIGYGAGSVKLVRAMAKLQTQSTSSPNSIAQWAALAALEGPTDFLAEHRKRFEIRRDMIQKGLNEVPGMDCPTPRGAFYAFPSCGGVLGRTTPDGKKIATDADLVDYLMENHDVALAPGSAFGMPGYLRLSYASADDKIAKACERIKTGCAELS